MTTTASAESSWLTIQDAADQLGIHSRTLRRYMREDRIKVMRLSQQVVRIRPEDLMEFRDRYARIDTKVGTCYVPYPDDVAPVEVSAPEPTKPVREDPDQEQLSLG